MSDNSKLKIAFDPTDVWNREDLRNIMKEFVLDPEVILYIVSKNTDLVFLNNAANDIGLSLDNVYKVSNNDAIVSKLDELVARIYISGDNPTIRLVDAHSEWAVGVLINNIVDNFNNQMMYITKLKFWIKQISREINGTSTEEESPCQNC